MPQCSFFTINGQDIQKMRMDKKMGEFGGTRPRRKINHVFLSVFGFYVFTEDFDNDGRRQTFQYGDGAFNAYYFGYNLTLLPTKLMYVCIKKKASLTYYNEYRSPK